uniref:Uncharacterized protein n=1 Tax=Solanum lycopersicum TaxID=4081 RepID=A0A3Q7FWV1_SOLLC
MHDQLVNRAGAEVCLDPASEPTLPLPILCIPPFFFLLYFQQKEPKTLPSFFLHYQADLTFFNLIQSPKVSVFLVFHLEVVSRMG